MIKVDAHSGRILCKPGISTSVTICTPLLCTTMPPVVSLLTGACLNKTMISALQVRTRLWRQSPSTTARLALFPCSLSSPFGSPSGAQFSTTFGSLLDSSFGSSFGSPYGISVLLSNDLSGSSMAGCPLHLQYPTYLLHPLLLALHSKRPPGNKQHFYPSFTLQLVR